MSGDGAGRPVVVVASQSTSTQWAARLVALGVPSIAVPWSVIGPGPDRAAAHAALRAEDARPTSRRIVLLTSKHAVAYVEAGAGAGWRAIAVGAETARAARAAGFTVDWDADADSAAGFAAVAKRLLESSGPAGRAIWLRGESAHRAGVDMLARAGWDVDEYVMYVAEPRVRFEADLRAAMPVRAWVVGSPAAADALRSAQGALRFPPPVGGARLFVRGATTAARVRVGGRVEPEVVVDMPDEVARRLAAST